MTVLDIILAIVGFVLVVLAAFLVAYLQGHRLLIMAPLTLPLNHSDIERILPHRYPFLLIDRIVEFEVDKRVVGIKNVSLNDPYLSQDGALPPTILTEAVAQVGAFLILAKPENRGKLPLFRGIESVRYRRPLRPGDVVEIEVLVKRLRSQIGLLAGTARVDGRVVLEGVMKFALGNAPEAPSEHP